MFTNLDICTIFSFTLLNRLWILLVYLHLKFVVRCTVIEKHNTTNRIIQSECCPFVQNRTG